MYIHISVKLFSQFVYLQMYCHRKYRIIYAAFEINVLYLNLFSYSVFCIQCPSPPPPHQSIPLQRELSTFLI